MRIKKVFLLQGAVLQISLLVLFTIAISVMLGKEVDAAVTWFSYGTKVNVDGQTYTVSSYMPKENAYTFVETGDKTFSANLVSAPGSTTPPPITKVPTKTSGGFFGTDATRMSHSVLRNPPLTGTQVSIGSQQVGGNPVFIEQPSGMYRVEGGIGVDGKALAPFEITKGEFSQLSTRASYSDIGYEGAKTPLGTLFPSTPILGNLVTGVMWAGMVVGLVQLIGNLAGFDKSLTNALSYSLGGGIVGGYLVKGIAQQWGGGKLFGMKAGTAGTVFGLAITVAIFLLTYKKENKEQIKFQCLPFEPPLGGKYCEECNKDPMRPCSEYRCRALGQGCKLLNPNTEKVQCAYVSRNDVNTPKIILNESTLYPRDLGLKYAPDDAIRPPAIGTKIVSSESDSCLLPYTALEFGFETDEPAQCKIDFNHTNKYDDMQFFVGDSNYYEYHHVQKMKLPGAKDLGPVLQNDGRFSLFVRCRDGAREEGDGNAMVDEYVFSFCVQKGPDTTPPKIEGFSIPSGSYINFDRDTVDIETYVNEPAECRWSVQDKDYETMENEMRCATSPTEINAELNYVCKGNLTGIRSREDNQFYFRCKDQPGEDESVRNPNKQSILYVIKGSRPLDIISTAPNGTISNSTDIVKVQLKVETSNGAQENGNATCYLSPTTNANDYVEMFETKSYVHKQILTLGAGNYTYFFQCIDLGGNVANGNTTFAVYVDKDAPILTRAYKDNNALKIVTDENASCIYSTSTCNYQWKDGKIMQYSKAEVRTNHFAEWKENGIYYIKCKDDFGNQPDESRCDIVVRAVDIIAKGSSSKTSGSSGTFLP